MKKFGMLAVMLLAAGPVVAQPTAPAPDAVSAKPTAPKATSSKETGGATVEARVNERIAQMHARLKITPAQDAAWNGFAAVMQNNVTSTDQAYKERSATIATMSAPDNMRNFAQIEQARAQGIQNLAASFQTLYDGMSDDQKKTADAMFRHYENHGAAGHRAPK
jgi:hypothetical protein